MPATVKLRRVHGLGSGPRGWLQRQAAKGIAQPDSLAIIEPIDLIPGAPANVEVLDLEVLPPSITTDLWVCQPEMITYDVTQAVPETQSPDLLWQPVAISQNLSAVLASGRLDGTLFFRVREEELTRGKAGQVPVVTPTQRRQAPGPALINVFELLLPVLLPPVKTQFGQELLLPQELYKFQAYGVKWLVEHDAALLADDMGLGKTVQAITAFRLLLRKGKALQCLVVCPKSVVSSWRHHFADWAPELQVVTIKGPKQARDFQWAAYAGKAHVILANYELLRNDIESAGRYSFDLVVADEIHKIKNPSTATAQAIRDLKATRRWGLTGTPLENRLEDVVAIFDFIQPDLFQNPVVAAVTPYIVRTKIAPFTLRRRKSDVLADLPPKVRDIRYVELDETQRKSYDEAEHSGVTQLKSGENITIQHVLALITRLKQICNFDPVAGESAKLEWLQDYLEAAAEETSKALVFSQFVQTLNKIEPQLRDYRPLKYTGDLTEKERDRVVQSFQEDAEHRVMLVSLKAGGTGITLTAANYVVHFDSWWNPAVMAQAEDRVHRIGQNKTVFVSTLVAEDTIEERIQRLLERKRHLFNTVIDDLSDVGLQKVLSEEELFGLFGLKPRRAGRGQQPAALPPGQSKTDYVIKPSEPFSNVVRIREVLRSCEGYIWWEDPHFGARALEELAVVVDPSTVKEIRILSRSEQFNERARTDFERFSQEMAGKGVSVEWRVTDKGVAHDRYIISANATFNVPPVNSMFQGSYGELLKTENRPPFEVWWESARLPGPPR
ncbi:MAG: DEAD/DEAH box helicase [Chloroflexota bacterium]|nr:DEAD/DEAH box helicase [Chloroflexota bacterium]